MPIFKERVLVVDDEPEVRSALAHLLSDEGFEVAEAAEGEAGLLHLQAFAPAAVLTDICMPGIDGLTFMQRARAAGSDAVFLVLTAHGTIEMAVAAMKSGADGFVTKPFDVATILEQLEGALARRRPTSGGETRRSRGDGPCTPHIIGQSAELRAVLDVVKRAAPTRATVLILGESGTGKELVAQALHDASPRRDKPFIKVSCAALSESLLESELFGHEKGAFTGAAARHAGRFELADGGTLFLDEIGEISIGLQTKLLRVLQTHELERVGGTQTLKVDMRLVAATNRDLLSEVHAGRFREDLFYRLNVVAVTVPPLRERKSDLPALVNHFIARHAAAYGKSVTGLTTGALADLFGHSWPGNVRELENAIERAVVLTKTAALTADDLPSSIRVPGSASGFTQGFVAGASMAEIERAAIMRTMQLVGGSTIRTAQMLKVSLRKVQYRLKKYDAERDRPRAS